MRLELGPPVEPSACMRVDARPRPSSGTRTPARREAIERWHACPAGAGRRDRRAVLRSAGFDRARRRALARRFCSAASGCRCESEPFSVLYVCSGLLFKGSPARSRRSGSTGNGRHTGARPDARLRRHVRSGGERRRLIPTASVAVAAVWPRAERALRVRTRSRGAVGRRLPNRRRPAGAPTTSTRCSHSRAPRSVLNPSAFFVDRRFVGREVLAFTLAAALSAATARRATVPLPPPC
jgi:hypothetical protein